MAKKIGFIGLGQMGKWMCLNLVKAGFAVTAFDLDPQAMAFLTEQGGQAAESPARLAGACEWVFLSLPNAQVVEKVLFGPEGISQSAGEGLIVLDLGTTSYLPTLEYSKQLQAKGVTFVDAPVSGMEARAQAATLTVMCGCSQAIFDELQPALGAIGNKVLRMGETGSGQLTKLVNQLLFNISCAAIAEMLPMAAKLGLDPEKVTEVVTTGTGRSFAAEFFAPLALDGVFDQGYPLKAAYKDMVSAAEISSQMKIPLPMTQAATTTYQLALAEGLGEYGKGAMMRVFERLLGVEFRRTRK